MTQKHLILAAKFNEMICDALVKGASEEFEIAGVNPADVDILWVPGSFELPVAAAKAARSGRYRSITCLGCVIRGETPHFDYVAGQAAAGIMRVSIETGLPIIFGVLTTDTVEQAMNRSGIKHGNKGRDAARAALQMCQVFLRLDESSLS